jgi:hypothetical protein
MQRLRQFFVHNWRPKLISLGIAVAVWYLITDFLDGDRREIPVPGTGPGPVPSLRGAGGSGLEDSILGPLLQPALPAPLPIPVPGGEAKGG